MKYKKGEGRTHDHESRIDSLCSLPVTYGDTDRDTKLVNGYKVADLRKKIEEKGKQIRK